MKEMVSMKKENRDKMKKFILDVKNFFAFIYKKTINNMYSFVIDNVSDEFKLSNELFTGNENENNNFPGIISILNDQVYNEKVKYNKMKNSLKGEKFNFVNNLLRWIKIINKFKVSLNNKIKIFLTDNIPKRMKYFENLAINNKNNGINSYLNHCNGTLDRLKKDKVLIDGEGMVQYIKDFMKEQSIDLNNEIVGLNKFIDEIPGIVTEKVTGFLVKKFNTGIENRNLEMTSLNSELTRIKQTIKGALGNNNNKVLSGNNIQKIKDAYKGNSTNKGIDKIIEKAESIIEENNKQKELLINQFKNLKNSYENVLDQNTKIINQLKEVNESRLEALKKNKTELNSQIKTKVKSMVESLRNKVKIYDATVNAFKKQAEQIIIKSKEIKNFATKTNGLGELISMNNKTITSIIGRKNLKKNGELLKALQGVEALIKNPKVSLEDLEVAHTGNRTKTIDQGKRLVLNQVTQKPTSKSTTYPKKISQVIPIGTQQVLP